MLIADEALRGARSLFPFKSAKLQDENATAHNLIKYWKTNQNFSPEEDSAIIIYADGR